MIWSVVLLSVKGYTYGWFHITSSRYILRLPATDLPVALSINYHACVRHGCMFACGFSYNVLSIRIHVLSLICINLLVCILHTVVHRCIVPTYVPTVHPEIPSESYDISMHTYAHMRVQCPLSLTKYYSIIVRIVCAVLSKLRNLHCAAVVCIEWPVSI